MKKLYKIMLTLLTMSLSAIVLINPTPFFTSVKDALVKCYTTLIPSLITFMTLSNFVCESEVGDIISRVLAPVVKKVFHLNRNCAKIILFSLIGGYPSGAKMINTALEKGEIDPSTADILTCFCISPSPAYVISAVGIGLFNGAKIGAVLYFSHVFTALLLAVLLRPKKTAPDTPLTPSDFSVSLVKAVADSTNAMVLICGFLIFFSPISTLIQTLVKNNIVKTALLMTFDCVTGVYATAQLKGALSVVLTGACLTFGGMSIIFQCAAMLKGQKINLKKIILFRFLHSLLTAGVSYFIISIRELPISNCFTPIPLSLGSVWLSVVFVGCCIFFLFSLGRYKR